MDDQAFSITRAADCQGRRGDRVSAARTVARFLTRALDLTSGAGAVATLTAPPADFVEAARARSIVALLGARFPGYGRGKVAIPRFTAGSTPSWVAEGAAPPAGTNPELDNVVLTPTTVTAYTRLTRSMIAKAGPDLDAWVMGDLAGAIGEAVDAAVFGGTGEDAQPTGLVLADDVPEISLGTDGGAPTRAKLVEAMKAVAKAGGVSSASPSLGWATSPDGEAKLRMTDGLYGGGPLWSDAADRILGKPAYSSDSVPSDLEKGEGEGLSALIYGDWSALAVNMPPEIDFTYNPYTIAPDVLIVASLEVAIAIRRPESFVRFVDLATS